MKYVVNFIVLALIVFAAYLLYASIQEPIAFQNIKQYRSDVVSSRLKDVRAAQEIYRTIKGKFAGSFDSLSYVLKNDSIPYVSIVGDPDDPQNMDKVIRTTTYTMAYDSIKALNINLDSLRYIPFTDGKTFSIQSDDIEYQSTKVNVVEVGTRWVEFMGAYGDIKYQKYDKSYDPNKPFKFGDLNTPSLSGNWE